MAVRRVINKTTTIWGLIFVIDICQSIALSFKSSFTKDLSFWGPSDISHTSYVTYTEFGQTFFGVDLYLNALNEVEW